MIFIFVDLFVLLESIMNVFKDIYDILRKFVKEVIVIVVFDLDRLLILFFLFVGYVVLN